MNRHNHSCSSWTVLPGFLAMLFCQPAGADESTGKPILVDTNHSVKAQLRPVPLDSVQWTNGFWAERYDQSRDVTLRKLWDLAADPEAGHVLDNMRIAGGLKTGEFAGSDWQDAWLYKWIESAAAFWAITRDPWVEERMDASIELIAAAQEDDGYIATQITSQNKPRFTDPREHEVYSMGHLLTAACVHHRVTGKDSLLKVATRCGDFLCETLGVSVAPCYAHNPSAVMGLVELYRETGQQKYLDCARMIVDRRGESPKPGGAFYKEPGVAGTDLIQDRTPLRRSREVVGHNVFFTYLYAGATDVFLENGDQTLWPPLDRLWNDLTRKKMCINGGVSPMGHGLSIGKDPVVEAVGPSYYLPSAECYNETCGQIGNLMWNYRMLCAKPDAKYADIMELEMYNGFLAGIGLDGESWFYRNSLRRYDADHVERGHNDLAQRILPGRKRICCPTNLLRTIAELQSYFYSRDDQGVWIHHFGGSTLDAPMADGKQLKLTQKTNYPWDGKIVISLDEVDSTEPFAIRVRVPGWSFGATAAINGAASANAPVAGQYLYMKRAWKSGDVVELNLPMPVRLMQAHPKAEQLRNQVAVMRGPLLYCLESTDQAEGVDLNNVYIADDLQLEAQVADDLPFGIVALTGKGLYRGELSWSNDLYRKVERHPMKPLPIRMIPYFAWANRGPASMSVWLPVVWTE
ncbi:MAG: glycoside hydrolase family 127 protein [Fuerstiella sp.]|nr:glycoside hydrolase family 127 protein [Fuerstiella sp.]MCP4856269.1 glycoside hydrolase family 127 protein [Fuerstiella sp.]